MRVVVTAECGAPPEVVFGTYMDIPHWPRFIGDIAKVDILSAGPIRAGLRFRTTRVTNGRRTYSEMKLTVMEAPWRTVITSTDPDRRQAFTTEVVPNGAGSRFTLTYEDVPLNLAARISGMLSLASRWRVRRQLRNDVTNIVREAERRIRA